MADRRLSHKQKKARGLLGIARFHHHHPSQKQIREERLVRDAAKQSTVLVKDRPIPLIDIGEKRISELIKSVTGQYEDAFQDAWVAVLSDHVASEEDVIRVAKKLMHRQASQVVSEKYNTLSLNTPVGPNKEEGDFTLEDIIAAPPDSSSAIIPDIEPNHTRGKVYGGIGVDRDVVDLLRTKYPGMPLRNALRKALHLEVHWDKHWKQEELQIIREEYPTKGVAHVAKLLERSEAAVSAKAGEIKLYRTNRNRVPEGAYNYKSLCSIFQCSEKQVKHIISLGILPERSYKSMRLFSKEAIIEVIKNHTFECRHEKLGPEWQRYVPKDITEWLPIKDVSKQACISCSVIQDMILRGDIPVRYYCSHTKHVYYVRLSDVKACLERPKLRYQPYKVVFGFLSPNAIYIPPVEPSSVTHYAYQNEGKEWVYACRPDRAIVSKYMVEELHDKPRFVRGYPTCKVCLGLLRAYRHGKIHCPKR